MSPVTRAVSEAMYGRPPEDVPTLDVAPPLDPRPQDSAAEAVAKAACEAIARLVMEYGQPTDDFKAEAAASVMAQYCAGWEDAIDCVLDLLVADESSR